MSTFTTRDGVTIYFKDWGPPTGRPVVLSHGWPLSADSWESQAFHLAANGFRVVSHDRRGHGRSSQPWDGNDMDHYADDLAQLFEHLDLRDVSLIGFSTGGGEVARYVGRHGTGRIAALGLISAVPPLMLRTERNPGGLPIEVFDGVARGEPGRSIDAATATSPAARSSGSTAPARRPSQGMIDSFWLQGMMAGHKNAYDCIAAFSATDFTDDLRAFDKPTLILHGDDDQIVPIDAAARAAAQLVPRGDADRLRGRAARHHRHAQGSAERRPADVPARRVRRRARQGTDGRGQRGPGRSSRLTHRRERRTDLPREEPRLFPGREVPALVERVVVDQLRVGTLGPAARCLILLAGEHADRHGHRNPLGVEEAALVFPIEARRRDARVGQPVERDVVEHLVARQLTRGAGVRVRAAAIVAAGWPSASL